MSLRPRRVRMVLVAVGMAVSLSAAAPAAAAMTATVTATPASPPHDVVLVGNSQAGTVSFLDGHTFANLGSLNVIPDLAQRLAEMDPVQWAGYLAVRQTEGGDRFVDDVATSPDGRTLYVSRGNLADVAAFDLVGHQMLWRFHVSGFHADHLALTPAGNRLVISATTAQEAQVLDTATGTQVATFPTGTYPHANDLSANGQHLYNSSIGVTTFPKSLEFLKGSFQLTEVSTANWQVIRTWTFPHGIRPAVITPDEKTMYAQLSYLNGFVEYNLVTGQITRTVTMPFSAAGAVLSPDDYPLNSAHHGMALSGDGAKLCEAGTIDDYAAIVSRPALTTDRLVPTGQMPYWALTSLDGQYCLVSNSRSANVSVISYATTQEVARVPVGTFPQRARLGGAVPEALAGLSAAAG
jgi:YVTN family beta-propeller protein